KEFKCLHVLTDSWSPHVKFPSPSRPEPSIGIKVGDQLQERPYYKLYGSKCVWGTEYMYTNQCSCAVRCVRLVQCSAYTAHAYFRVERPADFPTCRPRPLYHIPSPPPPFHSTSHPKSTISPIS